MCAAVHCEPQPQLMNLAWSHPPAGWQHGNNNIKIKMYSVRQEGLKLYVAERPPRPLELGEERFLCPVEDLGPDVAELSVGRKFRSCIEKADGDTFLE